MKCLLVLSLLLSACTASPTRPPREQLELRDNVAYFDCLAKLGQNQSKGYEKCAKLLG